MSTTREKNKKILYDKLTYAEKVIGEIMTTCSLSPEDKLGLLLSNIYFRLRGVEGSQDVASVELQDIYVNLIIGVMSQDMLESSDEISLLQAAIKKRIDDFEHYFEQLEKGPFKGPF